MRRPVICRGTMRTRWGLSPAAHGWSSSVARRAMRSTRSNWVPSRARGPVGLIDLEGHAIVTGGPELDPLRRAEDDGVIVHHVVDGKHERPVSLGNDESAQFLGGEHGYALVPRQPLEAGTAVDGC